LMHFGFFRFFNTFTTGLIFSYLYYKTHSLILYVCQCLG
jgi:membrane protease YdiL (CAAX protease family)